MATGPKTLSQLPIASSIAGSDRILILSNPATVPNTVTVTANAFAASIAAQMPIANTLSAGVVIVGNTLTVNVTGGIQVNTNLLLTNLVVNTITTTTGSSANLTIDPDGSGDVVFTSATQVFVQSATGATSTSAGDFVVSGGVAVGNNIIVGSSVNAAALTVGTTFIANTTGTYQTGTAGVNAVSYNIGTTFIANSTALTFTPNTYNFGSNSVTANGYVYLPGGMKMQWGSLLVNTSTAAQTWPTAYTTNVYSITATANTTGSLVAITTANSTKFTVITTTTANVLVYWTAVGT